MHRFLSEETIFAHREYVRHLRLKYSILTDAVPSLKNVDIFKLLSINMKEIDKLDALILLGKITCHDIYFSSFSAESGTRCRLAKRQFGSEDALAMCILHAGMKNDVKFVSVGIKQGRISIHSSCDYHTHFSVHTPRLMIDTEEHAYFWDYCFDKERYLKCALTCLNLSRLDENL